MICSVNKHYKIPANPIRENKQVDKKSYEQLKTQELARERQWCII